MCTPSKTKIEARALILSRAVDVLKTQGPMKAKKLADALGLPDARSLSMYLQHLKGVVCDSGKWKIK